MTLSRAAGGACCAGGVGQIRRIKRAYAKRLRKMARLEARADAG